MDDPSKLVSSPAQEIFGLFLLLASLVVWTVVAVRFLKKRPVLPYKPRRPVPWGGLDLLAVLAVWVGLPLLIMWLAGAAVDEAATRPADVEEDTVVERLDPDSTPAGKSDDKETESVEHPVIVLLRADGSLGAWLLCGVAVVVVAPAFEEFLFRLLLQGWLEAQERRVRRRVPSLRRFLPGLVPVVLASLLFAGVHFRQAAPPVEPDVAKDSLLGLILMSVVALAFAVWLMRTRCRATATDFGLVLRKLPADVGLGLAAAAAVTAPIIFLQSFLISSGLLPDVAADPIPLFFLALVLGKLYYRTHRIGPSIVMHMAFNGVGLILLALQLDAQAVVQSWAGLW
ncbi:MAG: lysostaphin resistance A-like protein [Planctomycetota bacterium]|jgi:membrane protease YdiL (CAAX protease family)